MGKSGPDRVCANRVKIDKLRAKVTLAILDALVKY